MVTVLQSTQEYHGLIASGDRVVIKYFADWCGSCKAISPKFSSLATDQFGPSTPNPIKFVKVNIDELEQVSEEAGLTGMPTFQFFYGGEKVDQIQGANLKELTASLEKLAEL